MRKQIYKKISWWVKNIKVEINIWPKNSRAWKKTHEDDGIFKDKKADSYVSKINTGNNAIMIELVQKK